MMPNKGVIMVHAGAGYHSHSKEKAYQELCEEACRQAMVMLKKGGTSLDAAVIAVKVLEDSAITNAGLGSALTLDGTVECDSSVMEGDSLLFGAVGAISGVKNPVCVARKVLDEQKQSLALGRIPPSILVGSGASQWARENGCDTVSDGGLITEVSLKTYWQHKRRLEKVEKGSPQHKKRKFNRDISLNSNPNAHNTYVLKTASDISKDSYLNGTSGGKNDSILKLTSHVNHESVLPSNSTVKKLCATKTASAETNFIDLGPTSISAVNNPGELRETTGTDWTPDPELTTVSDHIQDTVGAVCLDCEGGLTSAVSSGGILLKHSGRVGQAAAYGAGCWAEVFQPSSSIPGVAVSTSGCGEHLVRTLLARECAESVKSTQSATMAISQTFRDKFLGSRMLENIEEKLGGVIVIKHQKENSDQEVEILWAHTTDSMCIGYMVEGRRAKAVVSRLPKEGVSGKSFNMQGNLFDVNKS